MRYRTKYIQIKLYQAKGYEQFGWHSDKKALRLRIKHHEMGKRLAKLMKQRKVELMSKQSK